jgi:hypothetical protein
MVHIVDQQQPLGYPAFQPTLRRNFTKNFIVLRVLSRDDSH